LFFEFGSLSEVTVVTELNVVFAVAVESVGILIPSTTPCSFEMLISCPTVQVTTATVLVPTVVLTEQLVPPFMFELQPSALQVTTA
jgi:hypothetical protein